MSEGMLERLLRTITGRLVIGLAVLALALSACGQAPESVETDVEDVEENIEEGAEDVEENIEEGAEDVEEGLENVEENVEEGAEEVEEEVEGEE